LQEGPQFPEQGITGIMALGVVATLEVVDVQHDDGYSVCHKFLLLGGSYTELQSNNN
jgi:hypothetical protein